MTQQVVTQFTKALVLSLILGLLGSQFILLHHDVAHQQGQHEASCDVYLQFDSHAVLLLAIGVFLFALRYSPFKINYISASYISFSQRHGLSRAPPIAFVC